MTDSKNATNPELSQAQLALKNGAYQKAEQILTSILAASPAHADALGLLGLCCAQQGRLTQALPVLEQAASLRPDDQAINNNLALVLELSGQIDRAIPIYHRILQTHAHNIEALSNLGDALRKTGRPDEAWVYLKKALEIKPDNVNTLNSLGITLQDLGDFDAAESKLRQALSLNPKNPQILSNLAGVLHKQDRYVESIVLLKQVIELKPDYQPAWANLSAAYTMTYEYQQAKDCALKAIQLNPGSASAWTNLGKLYYELGEFKESDNCFQKSLSIEPHNPDATWNKSFTSLISGNLEQGWREYQAGLVTGDRTHHLIEAPLWRGEDLSEKSIIILAEQGLGDELMFASCLDDLKRCSNNIFYECDKRLLPLFQRSFPDIHFIARNTLECDQKNTVDKKRYDFYLPAGSLPLHFRNNIDHFPNKNHFLISDDNKIDYWRSQYAKLGKGLKVGISWRGGKRVDPAKRSIALNRWLPILQTKNCVFIDIQYGDTQDERSILEAEHGIIVHRFEQCNPLQDQDEFAAQLVALDLIISVSNATVHIAGALGQTTWGLIPYVPSWRWGFMKKKSPWYNNLTLYRQPEHGDWQGMITAVADKLRKLEIIKSTLD